MRYLTLVLLLESQRVAEMRDGESMRIREKRYKSLIHSLTDSERSIITEMHTQGMTPTHIKEQLALEGKGEDYVQQVLEALDAEAREPLSRRTSARPSGPSSKKAVKAHSNPKRLAHEHRKRVRSRKDKKSLKSVRLSL